jgi:hypothetical protein
MVKNINVYVNSGNKLNGTNSNFTISLPSGLLKCEEKFGLSVNLIQLAIPNTMSAIPSNALIYISYPVEGSDPVEKWIEIPKGFFSVLDMRNWLNEQFEGNATISYNRYENKFRFISSLNDVKIMTNSLSEQFIGLSRDIEYTIVDISSNPLDMVYRKKIIIETTNLKFEHSSIENLGIQHQFEKSSILYYHDRTQNPFNSVINYRNEDAGDSFNFHIHDKDIQQINFRITDEYDNEYQDLPDFSMILQFTIYERENKEMIKNLIDLNETTNQIYTILLMIMKYFNII